MKFAIQGHPTRGHKVIQILENLGGKNIEKLEGTYDTFYYIDNKNEIGDDHRKHFSPTYNLYTLEEFEKEFPFKIGDKVITIDGTIGIIDRFEPEKDYPYCIKADVGGFYWCATSILKPYKEMKEERNITLTLDKAKEWYKKGGELREIALQAFIEKELTKVDLPKTWEEFCDNYPVKGSEATIGCDARIINCMFIEGRRRSYKFKDIMPSEQSVEAHLAMIQLEQLRDCWRQGWVQTPTDTGYRINKTLTGDYVVMSVGSCKYFLSFPTREMAEEFLECFRYLIEQARDLI